MWKRSQRTGARQWEDMPLSRRGWVDIDGPVPHFLIGTHYVLWLSKYHHQHFMRPMCCICGCWSGPQSVLGAIEWGKDRYWLLCIDFLQFSCYQGVGMFQKSNNHPTSFGFVMSLWRGMAVLKHPKFPGSCKCCGMQGTFGAFSHCLISMFGLKSPIILQAPSWRKTCAEHSGVFTGSWLSQLMGFFLVHLGTWMHVIGRATIRFYNSPVLIAKH